MSALLLLFCVTCFSSVSLSDARYQPNCAPGRDGQVIVHLFSWRWNDIADECERVLGPKGYCGVQVQTASYTSVLDYFYLLLILFLSFIESPLSSHRLMFFALLSYSSIPLTLVLLDKRSILPPCCLGFAPK